MNLANLVIVLLGVGLIRIKFLYCMAMTKIIFEMFLTQIPIFRANQEKMAFRFNYVHVTGFTESDLAEYSNVCRFLYLLDDILNLVKLIVNNEYTVKVTSSSYSHISVLLLRPSCG